MTSGRLVERAGTPPGATAAFVADALRDGIPDDGIRVITVPAPATEPEAFVAGDPATAIFWAMPGGAVHAGVGAAATVEAAGADRFQTVREAARDVWRRVGDVCHPAATPLPPRLFGGFSFLPAPLPPAWAPFGHARFVLPRLLYTREAGEARLSVAVTGRELEARGADAVAAGVEAALEALIAGGPPAGDARAASGAASSAGAVGPAGEPDGGPSSWRRSVASIQARIEAGLGAKIVAARSRTVELDGPADVPRLLRRLERESATAARFLFRFGGAAFVGATPERLVGRTDREVRTEALAGTVPAGSAEREQRLLESLKDGVEHGYVVEAIAAALGPLCERLDYPSEPRIQRLRHVVHLQTPFLGRLRAPVHVLELVERLHPTPAVGGWPRGPALEWIETEEPGCRGWYAAPVGWFDPRGDGEFGVALRSALLEGARARLYAGAGIVRDSDAEAEFAETEVKLRTMLEALGVGS